MRTSIIFPLVLISLVALSSIGQAAFNDNGDGTIGDDSTELTWQKTDTVVGNFDSSMQYCQDLNYGGYDDWRMPSVQEIITLFDYPQGLDAIFDRIASNQWTKDQKWSESYLANVHGTILRAQTQEDYHSVRCVRGKYDILNSEYLINSGEYVSDSRNNLIWTPSDDGVERTFNSAKNYCENLVYASRSDWRLPTANEIPAITDFTAYDGWGPMVNSAFTIATSRAHYNYWTLSDSYAVNYPIRISFRDGSLVINVSGTPQYALCVCSVDSIPPTALFQEPQPIRPILQPQL
jgi:hypothetical protein